MSHPIDLLETLDHLPEDFEEMGTEPVTCLECNALLADDELILGAFCEDCRPFFNRPITGHSEGRRHLRVGVDWTSPRIRRGYRR